MTSLISNFTSNVHVEGYRASVWPNFGSVDLHGMPHMTTWLSFSSFTMSESLGASSECVYKN